MRIGWATPFNHRSAIGTFSLAVCRELRARGHEVDILRLESGEARDMKPLECDFTVLHVTESRIGEYDQVVANFGNHAPYHAHLMTLVGQRAPLGIFHDMEMRDFEWGLASRYQFMLPRVLGSDDHLPKGAPSEMLDPAARPTLATLASMTCGAVIHGPHYQETIAAFCPGPVESIPLCFPDTTKHRAPASNMAPGRRVAIFGVINENKQVGRVLEALALLRPRLGPVELHLAGATEDRWREAIEARAQALGIEPPIFHGYVSDDKLQDILAEAHAVCCLRYPVTEGGSASLATALYHARPLIVSDIASYAMIPDHLASKVSYGTDPHDLAAALQGIFSDPSKANETALSARDWAQGRYSAGSYADSLEALLATLGTYDVLARTARELVPAITTPRHEVMMTALGAFAEVLDWMHAGQGTEEAEPP